MVRVLLVDDDPVCLKALALPLQLARKDVCVHSAETAQAALLLIAATDYDTIVSDIRMPDMDGLALLAEAKILRPDTPVLLVTGRGDEDLHDHALHLGAYSFLWKPFELEIFLFTVDHAVRRAQLNRRLKKGPLEVNQAAEELRQVLQAHTIFQNVSARQELARPS